MDTEEKLALVTDQMHLEPAEEVKTPAASGRGIAPCGFSPAELQNVVATGAMETISQGDPSRALDAKKSSLGLYDAALPGGKHIRLLKTLLTSACERDCFYCPFRARRNYRRATFKPEEMAESMNIDQFKANIQFAINVDFAQTYLWGVEWWYWQYKNGNPEYWEIAKGLF